MPVIQRVIKLVCQNPKAKDNIKTSAIAVIITYGIALMPARRSIRNKLKKTAALPASGCNKMRVTGTIIIPADINWFFTDCPSFVL